jgi:ElaB/YqjD/DUF883 family membrane-anchored ribosome-binding protein
MSTTAETLRTPDALVQDISKLMDEVERMLSESTSNHAEEKIDLLRSRLSQAQDQLGSFCSRAKQKVTNGARQADETIRSHPYESLAIAAGVGLLVGALVGRKLA